MIENQHKYTQGLYNGEFRDNCGFGLMAHIEGEQSHALVSQAIRALTCMTHRGGINADGKTGDGCGLLMQMPDRFVRKISQTYFKHELGNNYACGMVFFSQGVDNYHAMRAACDAALTHQKLRIIGWREVETDASSLGEIALSNQPRICQVLVEPISGMDDDAFQRCLFVASREAENEAMKRGDDDFYICSLSSQVLSYKGLMMPKDLSKYYPDLSDTDMESAICVFHQRFSTNTLPRWNLAQPFRYLAHNGEINTISANRANMKARESEIFSHELGQRIKDFGACVRSDVSDSASYDQALELMVMGGVDVFQALRMMTPPAWEQDVRMSAEHKAVHQYNSMRMEPWDGPAGLVITDGRYAVCMLDRNGLRPARWSLANNGIMTLASEAGVNLDPAVGVSSKGRVGPGQMIVIDTKSGTIFNSQDIDERQSQQSPFQEWLADGLQTIEPLKTYASDTETAISGKLLQTYRKMFCLSQEEYTTGIEEVVANKVEAVGAMGDDTPMAVLSQRERLLTDYFRQMFAQVTNPAIDPLREGVVMSLAVCIGAEQPLFGIAPLIGKSYSLDTPVLSPQVFAAVTNIPEADMRQQRLCLQYNPETGLEPAITQLQQQAKSAAKAGVTVLLLSDKDIAKGLLPIHCVLATGAVHHHLVSCGLRTSINIVVETGFVRDSHQFACCIAAGATAIYPYLAFACIRAMVDNKALAIDFDQACVNYVQGIGKGLLKIISKMGISCIASYRGSQLFEAVGLAHRVIDICLTGMVSRIGGADFSDIQLSQQKWANDAWKAHAPVEHGGRHKWQFDGEYHAYNPDVVTNLRLAASTGQKEYYQRYSTAVNERPVTTLRDMLECTSNRAAVSVDEVEPVENILRRFDSAAMSLGALSPEAHEALAQAMNELGARSNSGEGGEDPARYGTIRQSAIKQIASGRFGVTAHYLVNAKVLQIKVAQGAKPGEGGQLPGGKVTDLIARLRYSVPGTTLISPPPHHDIYSIEDLAQLIFDLKQVNSEALVSVKLVSEPGIGTVASGVAKAYADLITVSGYDGGTAASPLASIHHAGSPWELGLSEVQQALRGNGLRGRVRVQTDGGLKTGLDVIKAAMLGAESFGFGTAPMIALGCKYLRICHLNNCATGVATQNEGLRDKHFVGTVDMVKNYFIFVAHEVREILASLGYRSMEEIIGHTELLSAQAGVTAQQGKLDLQPLLVEGEKDQPRFCQAERNPPFDAGKLGQTMLKDCLSSIEAGSGLGVHLEYTIANSDRSCGAAVSGAIARKWGNTGMDDAITIHCRGVAGQSFGVWNNAGLDLCLVGEANDYVGKGMSGGRIIITPYTPSHSNGSGEGWPVIGNTCLYGATGGVLYAAGHAGERFAVRNSGCTAVIEGAGDHCCEYMTGGVVVVLGDTGYNFGAGMTGGLAFVLSRNGRDDFAVRCNTDLIEIQAIVANSEEADYLFSLLIDYDRETKSTKARHMIDNYNETCTQFCLVQGKGVDSLTRLRKQGELISASTSP